MWHRVVEDFVIQMGGFRRDSESGELVRSEGIRDPIVSEANNGHSNERGTVAFALRGQDVDSANSEIFINLVDNTNLDTGPPPFTVFAHVIRGLDVVDEIGAVKTRSEGLKNDVPSDDIIISEIRRVEQ